MMISAENINEIINTIIVPIVQVGFPIAFVLTITEKIINMILSFVRGDKNVKL